MPPLNLSGITVPPELLPQFPLITDVSTPPTDLLSSITQAGSKSVDPGTTVSTEQTSLFTLDTTTPTSKVTTADRLNESTTISEKTTGVTDVHASES